VISRRCAESSAEARVRDGPTTLLPENRPVRHENPRRLDDPTYLVASFSGLVPRIVHGARPVRGEDLVRAASQQEVEQRRETKGARGSFNSRWPKPRLRTAQQRKRGSGARESDERRAQADQVREERMAGNNVNDNSRARTRSQRTVRCPPGTPAATRSRSPSALGAVLTRSRR
jgi:hypothetical protein